LTSFTSLEQLMGETLYYWKCLSGQTVDDDPDPTHTIPDPTDPTGQRRKPADKTYYAGDIIGPTPKYYGMWNRNGLTPRYELVNKVEAAPTVDAAVAPPPAPPKTTPKAAPPPTPVKPAWSKPAPKQTSKPSFDNVPLEQMSMEQLKRLAEDEEIDLKDAKDKEEIIKIFRGK